MSTKRQKESWKLSGQRRALRGLATQISNSVTKEENQAETLIAAVKLIFNLEDFEHKLTQDYAHKHRILLKNSGDKIYGECRRKSRKQAEL